MGILPLGVTFDPSGRLAYVANADSASNNVSVIETATNTVRKNITVGINPEGIAFNPSGTLAYVTNYNDGTISVMEPPGTALQSLPAGGALSLTLTAVSANSVSMEFNGVTYDFNTTNGTIYGSWTIYGFVKDSSARQLISTSTLRFSNTVTFTPFVPPSPSGGGGQSQITTSTVLNFTQVAIQNLPNVINFLPFGVALKLTSGSIGSIVNVTISNATGSRTPIPSCSSDIFALNVSIHSSAKVNATLTMPYGCGNRAVAPYICVNGAWEKATGYATNLASCTFTFGIPQDPILGILPQNYSKPSTTSTSSATTTTVSTVTSTSTTSKSTTPTTTVLPSTTTSIPVSAGTPQQVKTTGALNLLLALSAFVVAVVLIALFLRHLRARARNRQ